MNISLPNIILRHQSPFVSEKSLSKELIEKFRLDESDIEDEPVRAYSLIYQKTSEYNSDGHVGHIRLDANQVDSYFANEKKEKLSNTDLIDGVTYGARNDTYYLKKTNPAYPERTFTIASKEPITNEYLQKRYDQIQAHFHEKHQNDEDKYDIYKGDPSSDDRTLELDGRTTIIDEEEYEAHKMIYAFTKIHEKPPTDSLYTNWQYHNLLNIENKYENAAEFEALVNRFTPTSYNTFDVNNKMILSVSLGIVDPADQTYFINVADKYDNTFALKDIQNDTLIQATLDTIDEGPSVVYFSQTIQNFFGGESDDNNFQALLNDFARRQNEEKGLNNISSQMFTFTGDITIDENSTQEYKDFITNNLIDFFKEQKNIYVKNEIKNEFTAYEMDFPELFEGMTPNDFKSIDEFYHFMKNNLKNDMSRIEVKYFDLLINNLKKLVDTTAAENNSLLNQYTKNTKPNPLDNLEQ